MAKSVIVVTIVLIIVAAIALVVYKVIAQPNRLIIHNSSGTTLTGVHLTIRSKDGAQTIERDVLSLEPGRNAVVRHGMNDSSIDLIFSKSSTEYKYSESYIDLWTGEGWVLDVQPDGTVKSGYESVMQGAARDAPR